jgi:hypothetical protein
MLGKALFCGQIRQLVNTVASKETGPLSSKERHREGIRRRIVFNSLKKYAKEVCQSAVKGSIAA